MSAFALSFAVIFVAELGDKSQLMAMTFATRFRFWTVLAGITAATAVVHLISVALGVLVGVTLAEDEEQRVTRATRPAFFAVAGAFFLAELGDKTMLATVTLATTEGWFGVWVGSTLGMVAADAMAIGLGALLAKALPERVIRIGAAVLFFLFAGLLIFQGASGYLNGS